MTNVTLESLVSQQPKKIWEVLVTPNQSVIEHHQRFVLTMVAAAFLANGDSSADKTPSTGRHTAVYSEVQNSRLDHPLPLPSVLRNPFKVVDGPPSSAAGNPGTCFVQCIMSIIELHFLWSGYSNLFDPRNFQVFVSSTYRMKVIGLTGWWI